MSHRAWTFDPDAFHDWLEERIVEEGELRLDQLHQLARGIVRNASSATWDALGYMRFDEEYLELGNPDISYPIRWYMIALASWLHPVGPLAGWGVLDVVLPMSGWSTEDARLLIYGRHLGDLAKSSGNELFAAEFDWVWEYGWLDLATAKEMLHRLQESKEAFSSPTQEIRQRLVPYSEWTGLEEVLAMTYLTTQETLQTAVEREEALYFVLD
jgi:hypothetical protein